MRLRDRCRQRSTLGDHLRVRRRGGAGPRCALWGGRAVNLKVFHAFHSPRWSPWWRSSAASCRTGARSRGVPALLHRPRQVEGHEMDTTTRPTRSVRRCGFLKAANCRRCSECRLCRRGRSAIHAPHVGPTVTHCRRILVCTVRRTGFRWNGVTGRSCDIAARRVLARLVAVLRQLPRILRRTSISSRFWFRRRGRRRGADGPAPGGPAVAEPACTGAIRIGGRGPLAAIAGSASLPGPAPAQ